ncbi:hypothetical protein PsYK624_044000 [Phanerochaete sordida]|uniref:Uncharacterized protein n=1 Tax=Phanerochaete sordida TaxID=48140 RepID=A0A9P3LBY4_9APHY|nr:hypothetical protein PsYK624_044000 [Phanerochaete sordida]
MIFDPAKVGGIASASAWMPLLYDTLILALTLNRTLGPVRNKTTSKIAKVLLRDGILYYTVIFAVNLVLTLMIATAPPGLQNITAQLEQMLTVTMMSRITLHLREQARIRESVAIPTLTSPRLSTMPSRVRFTLPSSETPSPGPVGISVEETRVMHDDRGCLVGGPEYTKKGCTTEEWYEMASPPRAHIADPRRSWLSRTPRDEQKHRLSS